MIKKNRANDGFKNEKDFIKKLNMNKNHKYWKSFELKDKSKYYFIKVEGRKLCKSTNEAILPKSDVYICKINIDEQDVLKQEFYFDEKSKIDIIDYLKNSGVSIKMRNTNYQIDKCSIKKFIARFKDKELFSGATIYSQNINDFKKNHKVLKASNTTWREFASYFKEPSLSDIKDETVFNDSHKLIFKKIQKFSYKQIKTKSINNEKILNSLFKGHDDFSDPYYATWLLSNDELTKNINIDFYVTKGSSNGGMNPTVVFKPLK